MSGERERVTMALDLLVAGLAPYVERALKEVYGEEWRRQFRSSFRDERGRSQHADDPIRWDAQSLLTVMWDQWNRAFRNSLQHAERSLVSELREFRNQWAHQSEFDFDDTYRLLDSVERLLKAVGSPISKRILREKRELMRGKFIREAKLAYRRSQIKKRMWQDLVIYLTCCAAIVTVIIQLFGIQAWAFAGFVFFVFAYLAYQRMQSHPPLMFGPHECGACRRIIYGAECPYCEAPKRERSVLTATLREAGESPAADAEPRVLVPATPTCDENSSE